MSNVEYIATQRAINAADAKQWTPLDLVRQLLADMESGAINADKMVIIYVDSNDIMSVRAGVTPNEEIILTAKHQHRLLDDWRNSSP